MLYQIFTEDINRPAILHILDSAFPGYTIIPASGHWQGIPEPALVAEIETQDGAGVYKCAESIREANHQSAVLVEAIPSAAGMVTGMPALASSSPPMSIPVLATH